MNISMRTYKLYVIIEINGIEQVKSSSLKLK